MQLQLTIYNIVQKCFVFTQLDIMNLTKTLLHCWFKNILNSPKNQLSNSVCFHFLILVITNSVSLTLPFYRQTLFNYFSHLLKDTKVDEAVEIFKLFQEKKVFGLETPTFQDYSKFFELLKASGEYDEKILEIFEKMPQPKPKDIEALEKKEIEDLKSLQKVCNEILPIAEKLNKQEALDKSNLMLNESASILKSIEIQ
jgi:hypothetical protein